MDDAEILEAGRGVIADDIRAVASVERSLGDGFVETVRLLATVKGKVLVAGMGTSGATARRIAHLLSCGGTPSLAMSPADGLHGGLGAISIDDVVIAISKGGETDELNRFCVLAAERGAAIVAMTAVEDSTLAGLSRTVLPVVTPDDTDPGSMMAMGSALATCAVGDALAIALMRLRGYRWEDFERSHPGGAVGKQIEARG